jgi:hypothetical protein
MRHVWKEGDVETRLEGDADLEQCLAWIAEQPAADVSILREDEASASSGQCVRREDAIDAARRFYKGEPRPDDFIYKVTPEPL